MNDTSVEDLIAQVTSGDQLSPLSQSPKQKSVQYEERIRHKAIRPSARLTALITDVTANGGSADGIRQLRPVIGGLKKYTKNSRRPRGRYGRGLPKKGNTHNHWQCSAIVTTPVLSHTFVVRLLLLCVLCV